MLTVSELKALLGTHQIRLTKRLGQHHLINARAIHRIVESCRLSGEDTVVEIGAGLGALTEGLAQKAKRVIAVEVDRRIGALLTERMASLKQVTVACEDILEFAWDRVPSAIVVGAIPYQITSPIIVSLCESRRFIQRAMLVMQTEVAQRLVAQPGTRAYGRLSVLAQCGWQVETHFSIPRSAFFPPPEVDSTCVRLLNHPQPRVARAQESLFFTVVKAAFSQRRKTLVNCLSGLAVTRQKGGEGYLTRSIIEAVLNRLEFDTSVRGEMLSIEQFVALTDELACLA